MTSDETRLKQLPPFQVVPKGKELLTAKPVPATCVIAIATSAGGLKALSQILWLLPGDIAAAILIVQHLSPDHASHLAGLLNRQGRLHAVEARGGEILYESQVYTAPPNYHLIVEPSRSLALTSTDKVKFARPAGDVLFESVAAVYGKDAIGIVLTGGDGDGSAGISAIKAAGGRTIAQDAASSVQPSMPVMAVRTGDVEYVLPIGEIADCLIRMIAPPRAD